MKLKQQVFSFKDFEDKTVELKNDSQIYLVINNKITNIELKQLFMGEIEQEEDNIGGYSILQNIDTKKNILTIEDKQYTIGLLHKESEKQFRIGGKRNYLVMDDSTEIVNEQVLKYIELFDSELTPKQVEEAIVEITETLEPSEGQIIYERIRDEYVGIDGYTEFITGKENEIRFLYKAKNPERLAIIRKDDMDAPKLLEINNEKGTTTYEYQLEDKVFNLTFDGSAIEVKEVEKTVAQIKAEEDEAARIKAEADAKEKEELEAKEKADAEAKEKTELEAKAKADQEAKEKADAEAKLKEEEEAKKEEQDEIEAKKKADKEAEEKEKAEVKAKKDAEKEEKKKTESATA